MNIRTSSLISHFIIMEDKTWIDYFYEHYEEIIEEFENEEWSKPYTDIDEMFRDLGLIDELRINR